MRVVLDTNVLAAGFISRTGTSSHLLAYWSQGRFELIISEHLLMELENVYRDRYFRARVSPEEVERILQILRSDAFLTDLTETVSGIATHPEDDLILATALNSHAAFLITLVRQLLKLRRFRNTEIAPPGRLLAMLESSGNGGAR